MPSTPRRGNPYPALTDLPDFPAQSRNLALALETAARDSQGSFANIPVSSPVSPGKEGRYYFAQDQGVTYRDTGVGWEPFYRVVLDTTLPGGVPTEYSLRDLDRFPQIWEFRYRTTEPTYKWVFVGGAPLVGWWTNSNVTSTTSGSYVGLPAPSFSIPAGVYEVEFGANMWNSSPDCGAAICILKPDGNATGDSESAMFEVESDAQVESEVRLAHHHCRQIVENTYPAAGTITLAFRALGGTAFFRGLHLSVRPIQIA